MSPNLIINKPFASYAPADKIILEELDRLLGLDPQFPARRELAECLLHLLEGESLSQQKISNIRKKYHNAIQNVLSHKTGPVPLSRGKIKNNPLQGKLPQYPIPALLLEPAPARIKEKVFSIKALMLFAVILFDSTDYIKIAMRIRRILSKFLLSNKTIELMPIGLPFGDLGTLLKSLAPIQGGSGTRSEIALANDLSIIIENINNNSNVDSLRIDKTFSTVNPKEEIPNNINEIKNETEDIGSGQLPNESIPDEQSKSWIRNSQRVTPNDYRIFLDIERRSLTNYLDHGMQSSDKDTRNASAIVLLSFLTSQKIDTLLELRYGDEGEINANSEYCRRLKIPAEAFDPKGNIAKLRPRAEIVKLPLPPSVKQWLATLPNMNNKILNCLGVSKDKLEDTIAKLLSKLKKTANLNRIHKEKIPAALQLELTLLYRDETLNHIIAGRANQAPPASSTYICHDVSFLQSAYASAINKLLEGSNLESEYKKHIAEYAFDNTQQVSGVYPNSALIASFPQNAIKKLDASKQDKDIVEIHNSYVDYCLGLLMTATAHRPVSDPFPKLSHIDFQNSIILICDKVTCEKSPWRVVGIPKTAIKQIEYYLQYLKALPSKLAQNGYEETAHKITTFVNGAENVFPLFFYLNRKKNNQTEKITQKRLKTRWKDIWTLPPNYTRHIVATELMKLTGSGEVVKLQLGHNYDSRNQFGACSTISPLNFFSSVSQCLEQILQENYWHAIKSPIRATTPFSEARLYKHGASYTFGYKTREKNRKRKHEKAQEIIRKISYRLFDKNKLTNLSVKEVNEIENDINNQVRDSKKSELSALSRLIRNGSLPISISDEQSGVRGYKIEKSPFSENSMQQYCHGQRIRNNWFNYLSAPRVKNHSNYEWRLAEITVSAAISGGLHSINLLRQLHLAIPKVMFNLNDTILLNFAAMPDTLSLQKIWFPDAISTGLLLSLSKVAKGKLKKPNEEKYIASLSTLLQEVTSDCTSNDLPNFERLVNYGKALAKFELPGFLRDYASGEYKSASLPLSTLVRTQRNMALNINSHITDADPNMTQYWIPSSINSGGLKRFKVFKKLFSEYKKNINQLTVAANRDIDEQHKKRLFELLESDFINDSNWCLDSKLIAGFAMVLLKEGTLTKPNPAYNTVIQYTGIIVKFFVSCINELDFYSKNLEELEWGSIYIKALENTSHKTRAKLCTVLYQFHRFLNTKHGAREVIWEPIFEAVNGNLNDVHINANFISSTEYLLILETLLRDGAMSEFKRDQIALIIMFGYRFGTRINEALGILSRDVIYDHSLTLIPKDNYIGKLKTPAARRSISADVDLTNLESSVLQRYLAYSQGNFDRDSSAPFFLNIAGDKREVISETEVSKVVSNLLKKITGDASLCFQQFRHSRITALVESRIKPIKYDFEGIDKTILNRHFYPLHEIAVSSGHANDDSTLVHYTHCLDSLMQDWLPDFQNSLNDKAAARVLFIDYNSVRRKRLRNKSNSILSISANKELSKLVPIPDIDLKEYNVDDISRLPEGNSSTLSLKEFANILVCYTKTTLSIDNFLNSHCDPTLRLQSVVPILCDFEREFGFDIFQINGRLNTCSADKDKDKNMPIVIAKTQLNESLKALHKISASKFVENRHSNGFASDISIWIKTFHPQSNSNLISNQDEYIRLMMLLANYFDNPPVDLFFESQSTTFPTKTVCDVFVTINYKQLPSAIEKLKSLQAKSAQLKIKRLLDRNSCLISIFIIGAYLLYIEKEI
ncbi:MAG: integrase [Oleiphilaceae bacterium]|jgi:integrase